MYKNFIVHTSFIHYKKLCCNAMENCYIIFSKIKTFLLHVKIKVKVKSKQELKLRVATRSKDLKKIAEALNTLPGAEGLGNRVPHLEGEEIFGSTKRKLNVPIGDVEDSHRPDKVNFSQPRVQTRSTIASLDPSSGKGKELEAKNSPHVTVACESDCDTSKWYIARISHKSNAKCHAQQRGSNIKCTTKIAREKKGTPTPTIEVEK